MRTPDALDMMRGGAGQSGVASIPPCRFHTTWDSPELDFFLPGGRPHVLLERPRGSKGD